MSDFFEKTVLGSSADPNEVANVAGGKLPVQATVEGLEFEDGAARVALQDQSTDILDYYFRRDLNALSFSVTQTLDSYDIIVSADPGVTVGNLIRIQEEDRLFQAQILAVSSTTFTLDTPLDYPFTSAASVAECSCDMNVDGSVTPVIFSLEPDFDYKWDVVRVMFSMTHTAAGDDGKFGDQTSLTRGLVLRKKNAINHTIFNVKNNGEIRLRAYDLEYSDRAGGGPGNAYGTAFRRTFGGPSKNGVVVRLDGSLNESLQILIQDDLTGLGTFKAVLQGHLVE